MYMSTVRSSLRSYLTDTPCCLKNVPSVWGRNLTDRDYDTFYFKSVSRSFFSKGRPISFGIKLNVNI